MSETFILIPGRTARQGTSLNEGKYGDEYKEETSTLTFNAADMKRLELNNGDRVIVTSAWGEAVLTCKQGPKDELPPGLLFVPYGPPICPLIGGNTHASGMPDSKGIDVTVQRLGS